MNNNANNSRPKRSLEQITNSLLEDNQNRSWKRFKSEHETQDDNYDGNKVSQVNVDHSNQILISQHQNNSTEETSEVNASSVLHLTNGQPQRQPPQPVDTNNNNLIGVLKYENDSSLVCASQTNNTSLPNTNSQEDSIGADAGGSIYRGLYPIAEVKQYFRRTTDKNGQKIYTCIWEENGVICGFTTKKYSQHISRHIFLKHIGIKSLKCDICSKNFKRPESLVQHRKNHKCGFGIDQQTMKDPDNVCGVKNLKKYFRRNMDNDITVFHCTFGSCGFVTNNAGSIRRHVHNQHVCPFSAPGRSSATTTATSKPSTETSTITDNHNGKDFECSPPVSPGDNSSGSESAGMPFEMQLEVKDGETYDPEMKRIIVNNEEQNDEDYEPGPLTIDLERQPDDPDIDSNDVDDEENDDDNDSLNNGPHKMLEHLQQTVNFPVMNIEQNEADPNYQKQELEPTSSSHSSNQQESSFSPPSNPSTNESPYSLKRFKGKYKKLGPSQFLCLKPDCGFQANTQVGMVRHLWQEVNYTDFSCDVCKQRFANEFTWYRHRKQEHQRNDQQQIDVNRSPISPSLQQRQQEASLSRPEELSSTVLQQQQDSSSVPLSNVAQSISMSHLQPPTLVTDQSTPLINYDNFSQFQELLHECLRLIGSSQAHCSEVAPPMPYPPALLSSFFLRPCQTQQAQQPLINSINENNPVQPSQPSENIIIQQLLMRKQQNSNNQQEFSIPPQQPVAPSAVVVDNNEPKINATKALQMNFYERIQNEYDQQWQYACKLCEGYRVKSKPSMMKHLQNHHSQQIVALYDQDVGTREPAPVTSLLGNQANNNLMQTTSLITDDGHSQHLQEPIIMNNNPFASKNQMVNQQTLQSNHHNQAISIGQPLIKMTDDLENNCAKSISNEQIETKKSTSSRRGDGHGRSRYKGRDKTGMYSLKKHQEYYIRIKNPNSQALYKCTKCDIDQGYETSSQASMIRHIWSHKPQNFDCNICQEKCENEFALYKHRRKVHPEMTSQHNRQKSPHGTNRNNIHQKRQLSQTNESILSQSDQQWDNFEQQDSPLSLVKDHGDRDDDFDDDDDSDHHSFTTSITAEEEEQDIVVDDYDEQLKHSHQAEPMSMVIPKVGGQSRRSLQFKKYRITND